MKESGTERVADFEGFSKHVIKRVKHVVEQVGIFDQKMMALENVDYRKDLHATISDLMPVLIKIKNLMRVSRVHTHEIKPEDEKKVSLEDIHEA